MPFTPFIEQHKERLNQLLAINDDTWEDLVRLVSWLKDRRDLPSPDSAIGRQVVIRGETDGTMGLEQVKHLFVWNPKITLLMSGGVYGREDTIGDIGAIDFFRHLEHDLTLLGHKPEEIKSRVIIDSLSQHTVHQGQILPGILRAIQAEHIFVVLPLYHLPRFILTMATGLATNGDQPKLIPLPYGDWDTHHPRKGPRKNPGQTFTYEELFALPPTPSHFQGKLDCGEIEKLVQQIQNGKSLPIKTFNQKFNVGEFYLKSRV